MLHDDGNLYLCCFPLDRNGLFRFLQPLDLTLDGVFGHGSRVFQILAFSHKSREGGDRHGVPDVFVRLEKSGVSSDSFRGVLHLSIIKASAFAHHFGTSLLPQRYKPLDGDFRLSDD